MRIVDLHTYKGEHIYCGRKMPGRAGSPLGNPFKPNPATSLTLVKCLDRYRQWLNACIRERIPDVLGCWCVNLEGEAIFTEPERCHCQVIAKAVRWLRSQGKA